MELHCVVVQKKAYHIRRLLCSDQPANLPSTAIRMVIPRRPLLLSHHLSVITHTKLAVLVSQRYFLAVT